jgi:hypothetical protein
MTAAGGELEEGDAGRAPDVRSASGLRRRACVELASVAFAILAVTTYVQFRPQHGDGSASPSATAQGSHELAPPAAEAAPVAAAEPEVPPDAEPATPAVPPPGPDRVKIAAAEEALDAASGDRARADGRAADAARRMSEAANQAALDALRARKLAFRIRDPSTRIAQAVARGGFVRGERDKLAKEVTTLRSVPRPKSVSILSKSPVARPVAEDEYHFELRHERITFIDLDRLMKRTKEDAQMRVRMSDRISVVSSKVGPVGAFSLAYELAPTVPADLEGLVERRSIRRYELQGWELIPESEHRGETYEAARQPISEFTMALNRINANRATITLWVYPDSFGLYRRLRADLTDRGFSVAARPLPAGLSIRGSPMGSQSAAQ